MGIYTVYRSQVHDCGNWERGRAVSFLENINWILFAVYLYAAVRLYWLADLIKLVQGRSVHPILHQFNRRKVRLIESNAKCRYLKN